MPLEMEVRKDFHIFSIYVKIRLRFPLICLYRHKLIILIIVASGFGGSENKLTNCTNKLSPSDTVAVYLLLTLSRLLQN